MSDAKQAWKEWFDKIESEAGDLDSLANALGVDPGPFRPGADLRVITDGGRAAYVDIIKAFTDVRRKTIIDISGRAHELRKLPAEAKWLGDPKRARVLDIIAIDDGEKQSTEVKRLPRATRDAVGWSGHRLTRGYRPSVLIDRIVAGARLYAATRKP